MRPLFGPAKPAYVYEVLFPFELQPPHLVYIPPDAIEERDELFCEEEKKIESGEEIEASKLGLVQYFKLRPAVVVSYSSHQQRSCYLVIPLTKVPAQKEYIESVVKDKILERLYIGKKLYGEKLRWDSLALIDRVTTIHPANIFYCKFRLDQRHFEALLAKLKGYVTKYSRKPPNLYPP